MIRESTPLQERLRITPTTRSPARLLFIVAVSTMFVETGVMFLFEQFPQISPVTGSLLDGFLLTILIFPVLYLFMFRPLSVHITALESAEASLKDQRDLLEELVQNRTSQLLESERKLTEAQRIAHIGNWELYPQNGSGFWSDEIYRIFGLNRESIQPGQEMFLQAIHPDDRALVARKMSLILADGKPFNIEFRVVSADGLARFVHARAEVATGATGRTQRIFGTLQDITEQKAAEARINFLAYYDSLTGLPNRTLISDRIATAMSVSHRHHKKLAVLTLNIDSLKLINDSFGLPVGDLLLKGFANRLGEYLREEDSIARLSGDEFLILIQEIDNAGSAGHTAQRILERMQEPFPVDGQQIVITCSIGISIYPENGTDAVTLIKNAGTAMYFAKAGDRGTFRFFTAEMNALSSERLMMESKLRQALKNNELVLYYQPQLDLNTNNLVGFEALVRWNHPVNGMIPPDQFIPVAEGTGLIVQIGEFVMREACFQAKQWQEQGFSIVPIAVNVSSVQFRQKDFLTSIESALHDSGLDLDYLELELTESLLLSNADVVLEVLGKLKSMGVKLLIDDFGTGYSSLSYLKRLQVYKLKIDQSFVQGLPGNQDDAAIVNAIIGIASSLNMTVIAEGVETGEQLAFLRDHGCHEIQGYFYGKPLPPEAAAEFLSKLHARSGNPQ